MVLLRVEMSNTREQRFKVRGGMFRGDVRDKLGFVLHWEWQVPECLAMGEVVKQI